MTIRIGLLSTLALSVAGCAMMLGGGPTISTGGEAAVLTPDRIDALELGTIREIFGRETAVNEQTFDPQLHMEEGFTGGTFVFGDSGSVSVRCYRSTTSLTAAMQAQLGVPQDGFEFVEPTDRFPLELWRQEGPPATYVFAYGNCLVCVRMTGRAASDVGVKGQETAAAVAARIEDAAR